VAFLTSNAAVVSMDSTATKRKFETVNEKPPHWYRNRATAETVIDITNV
jgi:hypothetical protein